MVLCLNRKCRYPYHAKVIVACYVTQITNGIIGIIYFWSAIRLVCSVKLCWSREYFSFRLAYKSCQMLLSIILYLVMSCINGQHTNGCTVVLIYPTLPD